MLKVPFSRFPYARLGLELQLSNYLGALGKLTLMNLSFLLGEQQKAPELARK